MRTIPATDCSNFQLGGIPDERQGIVHYKENSTAYPFTARGGYSIACRDEPFDKLRPFVPWQVAPPSNPSKPKRMPVTITYADMETDPVRDQDIFGVGVDRPGPGEGQPLPNDSFFRWAIGPRPLYLNLSEPTILNLENQQWNPDYVVIPKDFPEDSWVYLIIYGNATGVPSGARLTIPAAHPVSLIRPSQAVTITALNCLKLIPLPDPPPRSRLRPPPTIQPKLRSHQTQPKV